MCKPGIYAPHLCLKPVPYDPDGTVRKHYGTEQVLGFQQAVRCRDDYKVHHSGLQRVQVFPASEGDFLFESHLPGEKLQQLIVVSGSVFQGGIATVHGNHASDYVLVERNVLYHRFLKHRHNQDYRYRRQNILEDDSSFSVKLLSHCQNELVPSLPELTLLPLPNPPSPDPELPELKPPRPVPEPPEDEPPPPAEPTLLFFPGWR